MHCNIIHPSARLVRWALGWLAGIGFAVGAQVDGPFGLLPALHATNRAAAEIRHTDNQKRFQNQREDVLVLPGVVADRQRRRVEVDVELAAVAPNAPCEFLLLNEASDHTYETLLIAFARPSDVHRALEFLGFPPGEPYDPEDLRFWPKGDSFTLRVAGPDGKVVPVESFLLDRRTGQAMPSGRFLFTGSKRIKSADGSRTVYAADDEQPKAIASLFQGSLPVLEVPDRATKSDVYQNTVIHPEPPLKDPGLLTLFIEPTGPPATARRQEVQIIVRSTNSSRTDAISTQDSEKGGLPRAAGQVVPARSASGATSPRFTDPIRDSSFVSSPPQEPLRDLRLHLASAGNVILENGSVPEVLEAFSKLKKESRDLFLTVLFDPDLNLASARAMAGVLAITDSDRGTRVEPPPAGQLYYRAFLPNPEIRIRESRLFHPLELHLSTEGESVRARLVWVRSAETPDDSGTRLETDEVTVTTPEDLRREVDQGMRRVEARDGRPGFPVALVVAPPTLRMRELMRFVGPLQTTHKTVHVFPDEEKVVGSEVR